MKEQFTKQIASLPSGNLSEGELTQINDQLRKLERFWANMMKY
jgi:hypothetical protein